MQVKYSKKGYARNLPKLKMKPSNLKNQYILSKKITFIQKFIAG